jgi:uncharacterized protein
MIRRLILLTIDLYQAVLRPFLGAHCRFDPSCSEYARQAFLRLGFFAAAKRALSRLLRCPPFTTGGLDPLTEI